MLSQARAAAWARQRLCFSPRKVQPLVLGERRRNDRLQTLINKLTANGGKALAVTTDVTHCDQVRALVDTAVQKYRRIDVTINNEGLMPQSLLERLKIEEWELGRCQPAVLSRARGLDADRLLFFTYCDGFPFGP